MIATVILGADPWRYAVLVLSAFCFGTAAGVTHTSWTTNRRLFIANAGVSLIILSIIMTTMAHLDTAPVAGVYVEIVGELVYLFGNAILYRRAMQLRAERRL